jgi:glycosyltransferase involved in cell wall biosynthesis
MPRVAILFDNFGPYHLARLKASSGVCDLLAVEFGSSSSEYDWKASEAAGLRRVALNEHGSSESLSSQEFQRRLHKILDDLGPDAVVVPGWGYRGALLALQWCLSRKVSAVVMSESTAWDDVRKPIKEWVKRRIISLFSAALVGGTPHRDYMKELGMPSDRIFLGYDAIDNDYFETKTKEVQNSGFKYQDSDFAPSRPYFLASARFIEKKNLSRLLRAYAWYRKAVEGREPSHLEVTRQTAEGSPRGAARPAGSGCRQSRVESMDSGFRSQVLCPQPPFDLILLGDGALRSDLSRLISDLGIDRHVRMPGFKQYEELPSYYAHAGAFIHASTTEQWGLVVNEAMASGLPVLVSNRCGCATDLVKEGVNGWTFDPTNEEQMADLMLRISSDEEQRKEMGRKSREIIAELGPARFASGISSAIDAALSAPRKKAGLLGRLILWVMARR